MPISDRTISIYERLTRVETHLETVVSMQKQILKSHKNCNIDEITVLAEKNKTKINFLKKLSWFNLTTGIGLLTAIIIQLVKGGKS